MANAEINLFHFYRRYLWNEIDFAAWQEGMVDSARGAFQGAFAGAVLEGFEVDLTSGMGLEVQAGIACGPTGYLNVTDEVVALSAPVPASLPVRHLVVARPNLIENTPITRPTTPFDTVYLKQTQATEVILIEGTEAESPVYPATEPNDVVLAGVRVAPGATGLADEDLDFEIRDTLGKNSNFQQDAGRWDDRLRPYRSTNKVLGIKPSQLQAPFAKVFSFVSKAAPSIFPKDSGGDYNPADTFLNFESGAITGGDEVTPDFIPTIPTAGNAIVATVGILSDDTISVVYGTEGTREQCFQAITNQSQAGAGSVGINAAAKLVAFVVLYSEDGSEITELDFVDCRGPAAVGEIGSGVGGGGITTPGGGEYPLQLTPDDDGKVIVVGSSGGARTVTMPVSPGSGFKVTIVDGDGFFDTNPCTIARAGGVLIQGINADFLCESSFGSYTFQYDGTGYKLIAR